MSQALRIAFAGTPDFAVPTLEALIQSSHEVVTVLTQPDRPKGRGRQSQPSPVKTVATQAGIPVLQPHSLKDAATQQTLRALLVDVIIVVAYGLWVPPTILTLPKFGCINLHASILPRHRGAAPIVHALLAGDEATGVGIMAMDEHMDTGPVYRTITCPITDEDDAISLNAHLANLSTETLLDLLDAFARGDAPQPKTQPSQGTTLAPKIQKTDARIDWQLSAVQIHRHVRAYALWPVAYTSCQNEAMKVHRATVLAPEATSEHSSAPPGTIIKLSKHGMDVQTGNGVLRILKLQKPGGRALDIQDAWHQPCFQSDGKPLQFDE